MKRLHQWEQRDVVNTLPGTLIYTEDIATQSNSRAGFFTIRRVENGLQAAIEIRAGNPVREAIEKAVSDGGWAMGRKGPVLLCWERGQPWLPLDVLEDAQAAIAACRELLQGAEEHGSL